MRAVYGRPRWSRCAPPNLRLFQEAVARVRGAASRRSTCSSSTRSRGCSSRPRWGRRARRTRCWRGVDFFRQADIVAVPIWRMAHDAGASIAGAARRLGVEAVLVGTSQRSAVWHLLRGNVLKSLVAELPDDTRVWICN